MTPVLTLVLAAAAASPHHAPPRAPRPPPSLAELTAHTPSAIFTYSVDGRCAITGARKLQGNDQVRWDDADSALDIVTEAMVFRYVDGLRTRLRERRVRLLGELVEGGELVCHLRPSGEVVAAWIERHDESVARRRAPQREPVMVRDGKIGELGTYSLSFQPDRPEP